MKKLSVIRGDSTSKCPYGLNVIQACNDVGGTILQMQALESVDKNEEKKTKNKNKVIYLTQRLGERCPFANEILEKFNKVDCSWGDTAAGEGVHYLTPSPLYPKNFIGDNTNPTTRVDNRGVNVVDPRLYFDEPERGIDVPFGMYSIFSSRSNETRLLKIAEKYTNKITNIRDKLALLRDRYLNTLNLITPGGSAVKLSDEQLEKLLFVINDWAK